jgi:hypothetical protein
VATLTTSQGSGSFSVTVSGLTNGTGNIRYINVATLRAAISDK